MKIHEIVRSLREDRDLRQVDVAEMLNFSQQQYSRFELGKYEIPSSSLAQLADFYGVSLDYIFGRTAFEEGMEKPVKLLATPVLEDYTIEQLVYDVTHFNEEQRKAIVSFIAYQKTL